MKANLLPSLFYLLCVLVALSFVAIPAPSDPAGRMSASFQAGPSQTKAAEHSNIELENWSQPKSGWLYVLDPKPDATGAAGRVWLIDPESAKVMGSIRTGSNADFALSPDGARLYVTSITQGDSSELAVIDTARGVVLKRDTIEDREVGNVLPSFSTMAVSGDGLALRILRDTPESADRDMFLLDTFDTLAGEFQSSSVRLYNCGPGRFISYPSAGQFDVLCPRSNRIRLIRFDSDSGKPQNVDVELPWERRIGVAEAIEAAGAHEIAIIRGDGAVFKMDLTTHEFAKTPAHFDLPNRIPPAAWPVSPDGGTIYLGYNRGYEHAYDNRFYLDYGRPPNLRPNDATAGEFRVFDTQTWNKVGTIKTKMAFWSAVISNDGKVLYAMVPQKHSILVIDTVKMLETRILKVGGAPSLAVVAP